MDETPKIIQSDHDLLIQLNTRVGDLIRTIERMDSNMAKDIGGLRDGKLDKTEFVNHITADGKEHESFQKEIDKTTAKLELQGRYIWIGIGIMIAL